MAIYFHKFSIPFPFVIKDFFLKYFYIGHVSKVNVFCTTALNLSFDDDEQTLTTSISLLVPCTGWALGPSPWAGPLQNVVGRARPAYCGAGPGLKKY